MKQLYTSILIIFCLITSISAQDSLVLQTKAIMESFPNGTEISVLVIEDSIPTYIGLVKESDSIRIIDNRNAVFEIGSVTKVFTSTALAMQVEEGKIKLDDQVAEQLALIFKDSIDFTFQQLSNHTSGLRRLPDNLMSTGKMDPFNPYAHYTFDDLMDYMTHEVEVDRQVEASNYSNLGAGFLGDILAMLDSTDYANMMESRIFSRYEMNNTTLELDSIKTRLVPGKNPTGLDTPNWEFGCMQGAGAILSTTEDLGKFAMAHLYDNNIALNLSRKRTFTMSEKMGVALGWHIVSPKGKEIHWHNGGTGGYVSSFGIDIANEKAVIILSNISAFSSSKGKIDQLCFTLIIGTWNK